MGLCITLLYVFVPLILFKRLTEVSSCKTKIPHMVIRITEYGVCIVDMHCTLYACVNPVVLTIWTTPGTQLQRKNVKTLPDPPPSMAPLPKRGNRSHLILRHSKHQYSKGQILNLTWNNCLISSWRLSTCPRHPWQVKSMWSDWCRPTAIWLAGPERPG